VQKFSKKGWLCKTWEGELALVTMPGTSQEKFYFTVLNDDVAEQINRAMGKRVSLHYVEKVGIPSTCFGETRHYVNEVRAVEDIPLAPGIVVPNRPPAEGGAPAAPTPAAPPAPAAPTSPSPVAPPPAVPAPATETPGTPAAAAAPTIPPAATAPASPVEAHGAAPAGAASSVPSPSGSAAPTAPVPATGDPAVRTTAPETTTK
jgi:hypothetical protein